MNQFSFLIRSRICGYPRIGVHLDSATGERPSPGAATIALPAADQYFTPLGQACVAAPGDGRSPKYKGVMVAISRCTPRIAGVFRAMRIVPVVAIALSSSVPARAQEEKLTGCAR